MQETFGIRALVEQVGVPAHTLRYYEEAGLMIPVPRNSSGRREYSPDHVRWVRFLLNLREGGMRIAQIRRYAELIRSGSDDGTERYEILLAHREGVRARAKTLARHLEVLDRKLEAGCGPRNSSEHGP